VFVSRALHTLYGTADTAWVGRLGPEAIAAVSTSFFASWTLLAAGDVLIAGVTALVARAIGAERDADATRVARTALTLALAMGIVVAAIGWTFAPALFRFLFENDEIARLGGTYLSLFCLLAPVFYVTFVAEAVYHACGDSRTPMFALAAGTALNLVLDPLLILGIGPFPEWGVRGAAIATIISECVVLVIYVVLVARGSFPLSLFASAPGSRRRDVREIFRIGTPHALVGVLFSVVYLFLSRITGQFGAAAVAALGVVNRLESLNYLTATAVGLGVATLVGQNLGANRVDRAEASANRGAALITISTGAVTVVFLVFAEPIARLFTSDPDAVREAVLFLRIVALSQIFMGWEIVYGHAFTGAGNTLPPMYVSSITSVLRIPLALWSAASGIGVVGIWWTISLTGIVRGIVIPTWFRLGRWKRTAVTLGAQEFVAATPVGPDSPEG
jgi:putative MATE family efflux protein